MYCSKCNMNISDDSIFCYRCGTKVVDMDFDELDKSATKNTCNNCGSEISNDSIFCYKCGNTKGSVSYDKTNSYTTKNHKAQVDDVSKVEDISNQRIKQDNYNSSNVKPHIEPHIETNKKGSNDKLIWICAVAVFMIIIGIGSTDYSNDTNINTNTDTNTNANTNNNTNNDAIQLTKTYTNKDEGISFNYPEYWIKDVDYANERNAIVYLKEPTELNYCASVYVNKMELGGVINEFSDLKPTLKQELSNSGLIAKEIIYTKIDGIDAMKATLAPAGGYTGVFYYYIINDYVYAISLNAPTNSFYQYEPIFNSIIESYTITQQIETTPQNQNSEDYTLSKEQALEVAQQFIDTHPLYERTITGDVEYEPEDFSYSTKGLYKVNLLDNNGDDRFMWVDTRTGDVLYSLDGDTLITGEEYYNEVYILGQKREMILFDGIKVIDYLGGGIDVIYKDFGPPIKGTPIDGRSYSVGNYMGYNGIDFVYDDDMLSIQYIVGEPRQFTYNGVTLDKNQDEIVALLGTPAREDTIYNSTDKNYDNVIKYNMGDYIIRFQFKNEYSKAHQIVFY